jgi:hypothetical protein
VRIVGGSKTQELARIHVVRHDIGAVTAGSVARHG